MSVPQGKRNIYMHLICVRFVLHYIRRQLSSALCNNNVFYVLFVWRAHGAFIEKNIANVELGKTTN